MDNQSAWEAENKFWSKYGIDVPVPEILQMKKVPGEILGINDEVYLKISEAGCLYAVKIGEHQKVSVLYAAF